MLGLYKDPALVMSEDIEYGKVIAKRMVRSGYYSRDDIVDTVMDVMDSNLITRKVVANIIDGEIATLLAEQESWPAETEYDRLHHAMQVLDEKGIVARENFSCCGNCGVGEIYDEIDQLIEDGRTVRGYAFFHQQGTEGAVEGEELNFFYGSSNERATAEDAVSIGKEVADQMRSSGLKVDWDGTINMCVMVGVDWKRRWLAEMS